MSDTRTQPRPPQKPRRAAAGSFMGAVVEWYDFLLYGILAATVLDSAFFPEVSEVVGTLAAFATFGVGFLCRPLGGLFFGHFGDRIGRKRMLVWTVTVMGVASALIGLLPTYASIGWWAPLLLTLLRAVQGFAVGGEWGGASLMAVENAPAKLKAFFSSGVQVGYSVGLILATGVVALMQGAVGDASFASWGWRIPFLLSAVVMVVGWWIRRTLHESPVFETEQERHEVPKSPLKTLFRTYTPDVIKVVFAALVSVISTLFGIYALTFGASTVGLSRTSLLWMIIIANVIALATIPAWAVVGDRIGRKPVFLIGALGSAALVWPFIWAVSAGNMPLVFVIGILLSGVVYPAYGGVGFALFSEQFGTRVRMSGLAVGTQFGFALGGFAPSIAAVLAGPSLANWVPVAIFGSAASVVATVAALTMRETYRTPLAQLGKPELV